MKKKSAVAFAGIITIFVTVGLYLLCVEELFELPIKWISLCFILVSEGVIAIKGLTIEKGIISFARLTTGVLVLIATILTAVLSITVFPNAVRGYVALNVLYLAVESIIDIFLGYFTKKEKKF